MWQERFWLYEQWKVGRTVSSANGDEKTGYPDVD